MGWVHSLRTSCLRKVGKHMARVFSQSRQALKVHLVLSCRGEAMNRYVPQSVLTPEGEVLDIHIVLNEMFKSGDKLFVEYSDGPIAYKAR